MSQTITTFSWWRQTQGTATACHQTTISCTMTPSICISLIPLIRASMFWTSITKFRDPNPTTKKILFHMNATKLCGKTQDQEVFLDRGIFLKPRHSFHHSLGLMRTRCWVCLTLSRGKFRKLLSRCLMPQLSRMTTTLTWWIGPAETFWLLVSDPVFTSGLQLPPRSPNSTILDLKIKSPVYPGQIMEKI